LDFFIYFLIEKKNMILLLSFLFVLLNIGLTKAQSRCIDSFPFYPPFCWQGPWPNNWDGSPAIPDTIIDHNIVTMPNSKKVGAWGNILIADTGNNRIVEINPGDNNTGPDYDERLQTTDFDAITFQIGYYVFNDVNPISDPNVPFPLKAAEPAPCNYEPDHSVNGPVWAAWIQPSVSFGNDQGDNAGLILAVVAGFDGCPDNRVRIFLVHYQNCYYGEYYDYGGNEGWTNTDYGYNRANCTRGLWSFGSRLPGPGLKELDHPTHAMQLRIDPNPGETPDLGEGEAVDDYSSIVCNDFGCEVIGCREVVDNYAYAPSNIVAYNGDILITDQGNNRILLVDFCTQEVEWMYGPKHGPAALKHPSMTQMLMSGNILIADTGNQRVVEITIQGMLVNQFVMQGASTPLMVSMVEIFNGENCNCGPDGHFCDFNACFVDAASFCQREYCYPRNIDFDTEMGSRLIVDSGNNTLLQYDKNGRLQFTHDGDFGKLVTAFRVMHKDFYLLTDQDKHTVSIWNKFKSVTVWRYSDLNRPSSAVMVGEETGISRSTYWSSWFWSWW
jgi:hypothetical protein